jgi:hypothetical protein
LFVWIGMSPSCSKTHLCSIETGRASYVRLRTGWGSVESLRRFPLASDVRPRERAESRSVVLYSRFVDIREMAATRRF